MAKIINFLQRPIGIALLATLIVLTAVGGYRLYTQRLKPVKAPAPAGDTTPAANAVKKPQIARAGVVQNSSLTPVYSDYFGRVSEVYIKEGQAVKAGQQLFKLEPAADAAAAVKQDSVPRQPPRDDYENALKEYNRLQKLYEVGAIPRRQLENAAAKLQALRENPVSSGQATVIMTLQAPTNINAQLDGIVTDLAIATGATVQAGQQVLALGGGQIFEVVVPLEQSELYLVHLGSNAVIEVGGQTITGRVSSIYPEVQENQLASFRAHIKLIDPPDAMLTAAMPVNVFLDIGD